MSRKSNNSKIINNKNIKNCTKLLTNKIQLHGKKNLASFIFKTAITVVKSSLKINVSTILNKVFLNISPIMEISKKRVGGSIYQIPKQISKARSLSIACRILVQESKKRPGRSFIKKLSEEIKDAYNNTGYVIKKKQEMDKLIDSNKVYTMIYLIFI